METHTIMRSETQNNRTNLGSNPSINEACRGVVGQLPQNLKEEDENCLGVGRDSNLQLARYRSSSLHHHYVYGIFFQSYGARSVRPTGAENPWSPIGD